MKASPFSPPTMWTPPSGIMSPLKKFRMSVAFADQGRFCSRIMTFILPFSEIFENFYRWWVRILSQSFIFLKVENDMWQWVNRMLVLCCDSLSWTSFGYRRIVWKLSSSFPVANGHSSSNSIMTLSWIIFRQIWFVNLCATRLTNLSILRGAYLITLVQRKDIGDETVNIA